MEALNTTRSTSSKLTSSLVVVELGCVNDELGWMKRERRWEEIGKSPPNSVEIDTAVADLCRATVNNELVD
jgi:hypothetical protein